MYDMEKLVDYIFIVIGGGGLVLGVGIYVKGVSFIIKVIGVELMGVVFMKEVFF